MIVLSKLSNFFDGCVSLGESGEDCLDITTGLHGDNSELIFFVHPNQECLRRIAENTTSIRPILEIEVIRRNE